MTTYDEVLSMMDKVAHTPSILAYQTTPRIRGLVRRVMVRHKRRAIDPRFRALYRQFHPRRP